MGELTNSLYQQTDSDVPDNDPYSDVVFLSADAVHVDAFNKIILPSGISQSQLSLCSFV